LALAGWAMCAGVPPAHATVSEDAAPILQHMIDATGGLAARDSEQVVHYHGRIAAMGLEGSWDLWYAPPDRWQRRIELGPIRFREGWDGKVAWRTDMNDQTVQIVSAADAAHAREEGWFYNERWALADQDSAVIRRFSRSYGEEATYDVLEITPPGGRARRVFVNEKTGFIERSIEPYEQESVEERRSNYRMLAGRKRPTVFESPTMLPTDKPVERLNVESVRVNQDLNPGFFSPPDRRPRAIVWQGRRGLVRAPFVYVNKTVLVKVSINGLPPADFILDTGCTSTAIDRDYALSMGLRPEGEASVEGISANAGMEFAEVSSITLAAPESTGATLRDFKVSLVDLAEASALTLWRKPAGLLGGDFLSRFVVTLDYDSLQVTLRDPGRFHYRGAGAGIPFELHDGIPVVDMTLDDNCPGKFMVDVGNSVQLLVHGMAVRGCRMMQDKHRKEVPLYGGGLGGGFVSTMCRLDSVRIGPYEWDQPVAALALGTHGGIGSLDIAGNIGNTVLERFRCTFDYTHQMLYLEPGRRYGERDRVSRFGALFIRWGTRVFVGNVLRGSAAYEAGLRWYDEIIAVDDKPLEQWTREEIDHLLEDGEAGSVHTVTYSRLREPEKTVEVTLRDAL
jgi:hypothetical protein